MQSAQIVQAAALEYGTDAEAGPVEKVEAASGAQTPPKDPASPAAPETVISCPTWLISDLVLGLIVFHDISWHRCMPSVLHAIPSDAFCINLPCNLTGVGKGMPQVLYADPPYTQHQPPVLLHATRACHLAPRRHDWQW